MFLINVVKICGTLLLILTLLTFLEEGAFLTDLRRDR
jgi:hypothetical protein